MNAARDCSYSQDQVLCGLRAIWDDMDLGKITDSHDRIDKQLKAVDCWEDIDFGDVIYRIQNLFGFACSKEKWDQFLGSNRICGSIEEWEREIGPRFTFAGLADFIAEQVPAVSLKAVDIAGIPSAPAGAFLGITALARQVAPNGPAFGPSTPIRKCFKGRTLEKFYSRIRWISCDTVPRLRLRTTPLTVLRWTVVALSALCACGVLAMATVKPQLCLPALGASILTYILQRVIYHADNRLPDNVRTFADLAGTVAGEPRSSQGA